MTIFDTEVTYLITISNVKGEVYMENWLKNQISSFNFCLHQQQTVLVVVKISEVRDSKLLKTIIFIGLSNEKCKKEWVLGSNP